MGAVKNETTQVFGPSSTNLDAFPQQLPIRLWVRRSLQRFENQIPQDPIRKPKNGILLSPRSTLHCPRRSINLVLLIRRNMIINSIKKFLNNEEGATTVEYAILLTLIVLVIAHGGMALGLTASSAFEAIVDVLPF